MNAQDIVLIIGAVATATALILGALGTLLIRLHAYHTEVNGRMTELLDVTRTAGQAQGRLETPKKYPPDWVI